MESTVAYRYICNTYACSFVELVKPLFTVPQGVGRGKLASYVEGKVDIITIKASSKKVNGSLLSGRKKIKSADLSTWRLKITFFASYLHVVPSMAQ